MIFLTYTMSTVLKQVKLLNMTKNTRWTLSYCCLRLYFQQKSMLSQLFFNQ